MCASYSPVKYAEMPHCTAFDQPVNIIALISQVSSADGDQQIGMVAKYWSGFAREFFTDAETFGIQCKEF